MAEQTRTAIASRAARPKAPKPMTATQRKTLATQQIVQSLGGSEKEAAITAALEAVSEHLAWDTALQQTVRQKYAELRALSTGRQKSDPGPMPKPIQTPGLTKTTPLSVIDPYDLRDAYGSDQLRSVLAHVSQGGLREAVGVIQTREPGTKPTGRRNQDLIDYIMQQVAPGY